MSFTLTIHLSELIQSDSLSVDTKLRILNKITRDRMECELLNQKYDPMEDFKEKDTSQHRYLISSFSGRFPEFGVASIVI